jgi:diguanylate cyclase (GGDEF)-like protein/PAS domain S-box-containing protein
MRPMDVHVPADAPAGSATDLAWILQSLDGVWIYAELPSGRCRHVSRGWSRASSAAPGDWLGRSLSELLHSPSAHKALQQVALGTPSTATWVFAGRAVTGARPWELEFTPHFDARGRAQGCLVQALPGFADFADTVPVEPATADTAVGDGAVVASGVASGVGPGADVGTRAAMRDLLQSSGEGFVIARDGAIEELNPTFAAWIGLPAERLVGQRLSEFVQSADGDEAAAVLDVQPGAQARREAWLVDSQGLRRPVELREQVFATGRAELRMILVRDRSAELALAAHVRELSERDALTGLSNRDRFRQHLDAWIAKAEQAGSPLALLFIDLDHFKRVNDLLGHGVGDSLLQTVAARLVASLRSTDLVARFGGDEFLVLLHGRLAAREVEEVGRKLVAAIQRPIDDAGPVFQITPSIGVALYPQDGHTAADLIKNADTAMYAAKARGRASVVFYDRDMGSQAGQVLWIESQLTQALARGELRMHLQPQVGARDGAPRGAEALIRWRHPQRGWVPPDEFVPVAEQQRLIVPIGEWMIREAAAQVRRWLNEGVSAARIGSLGVNLSSRHFEDPGFLDFVARVLREEGIAGHHLELELTERMVLEDLPQVAARLLALRELGVKVAVDDFGTGTSSLGQLRALPVDKVKIDRVFVKDLPGHSGSVAILQAIVQMAHGLKLQVLVEGVETDAQRRFLADAGCDSLQGHAISPALSVDDYARWLRGAPLARADGQGNLPF